MMLAECKLKTRLPLHQWIVNGDFAVSGLSQSENVTGNLNFLKISF